MGRIWAIAALAVGAWLLSVFGQSRPEALGLDAPATAFSGARADAMLGRLLAGQRPRPAGSTENALFRDRLLKELAVLGVEAQTQTGMSCNGERRWGVVACATVTNVIADVLPGAGQAVLLMAHADSVAAGPGAGDDASGVATVLETIRALKARGSQAGRPVMALFTDGEENGLLGAAAFLRDPQARARVGAVINMESRGNRGPSYLFQTSAGDSKLIDLYARSVPHFAASSLYAEIYKILPNDTDLTPFLMADITAYNFAFIGNSAHYHTPLDRRENIDPRSLQQHGDNALELTDALRRTDPEALKGGNAIYLDVLGRWLPRMNARLALPLSIAAFALIGLAGFVAPRSRRGMRRRGLALAMPPLLLALCVGLGFVLHMLAAWISGQADPSFAHPIWLRLSLGLGVFAVALLTAGSAGAIGSWLWLAGLAIVCAIFAPGIAPYFLFPSLIAAVLLLVTVRGGRSVAVFLAALPALVVWLGLTAGTEPVMGLRMHPLFTVSAAFALIVLLPLLAKVPARARNLSAAVCLVASIGLAIAAGLQPAYSADAPQRLNLRYVEMDGKASWLADPVARLPESLRALANFSATPERILEMGYVAPAGPAQYPPPQAAVAREGDTVTLDLKTQSDAVMLVVPAEAMLRSVTINGVSAAAGGRRTNIVCSTPDCAGVRVLLQLGLSRPFELLLLANRRGLPPQGAALLKSRSPQAVPSQAGDRTVLAARIAVPGR
jgi:hypothetical protein